MSYTAVVPAMIPTSEAEVIELAARLSFSPEIQLDIVDGVFAPTACWPYQPSGNPLAVKHVLDAFTLEVDLMVSDAVQAATAWEEAGADMLVFHVETLSLDAFKAFSEESKASVGVSAHGDTSMDTLAEYAQHADYIQLMGIKEIGAQGNPFDEGVLEKITYLRNLFPNKSIGVDGSVNAETIARIKAAGADRFICGSAIVGQDNPLQARNTLVSLIND
jgi:ribulose-phosphate 3-epimerase